MNVQKMTARNAAFQQFETLKRNREKRARQGLFFVEGVHPIEQAIRYGWQFYAMAYCGGVRLSGWAHDMLEKARPETVYELSRELMDELSDREQSCELIALLRRREDGLTRMREADDGKAPLYLLFDRPSSPGNLGTVIRSADAFGARGLFTTGHSADFYDPQCIRASIGAIFRLPFHAFGSPAEALHAVGDMQIVGTSAKAELPLTQVDFTRPTLLLIGNETFGLSKAWKEACTTLTTIPIHGAASSLNVGCAASICLYEVARQRGL